MSFRLGRVRAYPFWFALVALAGCATRLPIQPAPVPTVDISLREMQPGVLVSLREKSERISPSQSTGAGHAQHRLHAEREEYTGIQPVAFNRDQPHAEREDYGEPLDLDQFVHEVLSRNRSLHALVAAWRAAAQKYPQAVSLDDPMFTAMTAPGSWNSNNVTPAYMFNAAQKIPWWGKRPLRGQVALAEANAACLDAADLRLQLAQAAQLSFFDYYLVYRQLEITEANLRRLAEFRDTARRQYEANLVMQQDVLQAEVELAEGMRRQIELQRMRRVAMARINTLLHQPPDLPVPPPPARLNVDCEPAPAELLRQMAIEQRPDLQALGAKIRAESASLALAYKEFYPDFEFMARYDSFWQPTSTQGGLQGQVGVNMNVPVYLQKRRAAVREAMFKLQQKQADYDQRIDDIHREVESAYAQVVEMRSIVELYATRALTAAERNVDSARADYVSGKGDFLRLVAAQRQLLALQEKHEEAIAGYVSRLADLERVVGGDLPLEPPAEAIPAGIR